MKKSTMVRNLLLLVVILCAGAFSLEAQTEKLPKAAFTAAHAISLEASSPLAAKYQISIQVSSRRTDAELKKHYDTIFQRLEGVSYTLDRTNQRLVVSLEASGARSKWNVKEWNQYLSQPKQ